MGKPTWFLDDKQLERLINHDWRTTIRDGEAEAAESLRKGTRMNGRHIAWALLREAIKVARVTYAAPSRSGYPQKCALPDGVDEVTVWQMVSSYLRGELENLPEPDTKAPRPSAKQISRAEVILELWHNAALAGKGDKKRLKKAVYAKAAGRKPRHIHAATGLSYKQLWKAQEEASNDLWEIILRFSKKSIDKT